MTTEPYDMPLARIVVVPDLQPRVDGLNLDHVRALQDTPESWPPLVVVQQDRHCLLVDGFHRFASAQNLGLTSVPVAIREHPPDGDLHALAFALNAVHGRPLSLTDRRTEATRLLRAHPDWADREIGRRCGLEQPTVARLRNELEHSAQIEQTDTRVGRGGYTFSVGTNPKPRAPGELPSEGIGERLTTTVGGVFTSEQRRQQRRLASYFRRLVVALEDGDDLAGWAAADDAAEACRLVLGAEEATDLGERLGRTSRNVLYVAVALGYDDEDAG